jgi:hypothetical protein
LLDKALDAKRDILTMPLPDPNDDSAEAHRLRSLILAAADSTIEQSVFLHTSQLTPSERSSDASADSIEENIEERRRLERMRATTPKPN